MDLLLRLRMARRCPEALDFLKDWLVHHICRVDRAYLSFRFATRRPEAGRLKCGRRRARVA